MQAQSSLYDWRRLACCSKPKQGEAHPIEKDIRCPGWVADGGRPAHRDGNCAQRAHA